MAKNQSEAEKLAEAIINKVASGEIDSFINSKLSEEALIFIKKKNKNIDMIHEGTMQYFLDKTSKTQRENLMKTLSYKRRSAKENYDNANTAIENLKNLK